MIHNSPQSQLLMLLKMMPRTAKMVIGLGGARLGLASSRWAQRNTRRLYNTSTGKLEVERCEGYAVVRLKNAPVNTLTFEVINELDTTFKTLDDDESVDGIILTSALPNIFSSGLDLTELHQPEEERFKAFWGSFEKLWLTLYTSPLAVIGVSEGGAPAGGCVLMLSTDYRIMGDNPKYRIGLNETAIGMTPPEWLMAMCENTVGPRRSQYLLQIGAMLPPQQAQEAGYIDEVLPDEECMPRAHELMKQYIQIPREARANTKLIQRADVSNVLTRDPEASVNTMWGNCSGETFQTAIGKVVERLFRKN